MAENYSRYGDIDQLLEEVLLAPSNNRPLPVSFGNKDKLCDSDSVQLDVYSQVNKTAPAGVNQRRLPTSSNAAVDGIAYQLERLRRLTATGKDSVGKRCQSYEVLERVSSFRVHPPLPATPPTNSTFTSAASTSNQLSSSFAALDGEDDNVEYATEVTALRPIGKGIHTLKAYSRVRQAGAQGQQQQQEKLHLFPNWQRNQLHQSSPSLQPTQTIESPNLGGLRAATLKVSSATQRHHPESSIQQNQQCQHQLAGAVAQLTSEAQGGGTAAAAAADLLKPSEARRADGVLDTVKAACRQWYQPMLSRNEASSRLITQPPGSFLIRRSANHPGSFDLAVRAPETPEDTAAAAAARPIRHLLVERRSSASAVSFAIAGDLVAEVSGSLSELVAANIPSWSASRQLPCPLRLPTTPSTSTASTRIECSALYLAAVDVETATGAAALARATEALMRCRHRLQPRTCRLLAAARPRPGIRVTFDDGTEEEKYIPAASVLHCGFDPCLRSFDSDEAIEVGVGRPRIFGFVLRNRTDRVDNCVLLACDNLDGRRAAALVRSVRAWLGL